MYFSIEQVADRLDLHVRTVRNYVRDGKLKAVRIGKQYRITREDLEAFTGLPVDDEPVRTRRHVEVSSIVQIDAISPDDADRISTHLMAALRGGQSVQAQTVYDTERGRLKVVLLGEPGITADLIKLIGAMA
ncbi:helix-turn-helix domain-containing protein [Nonomuraea soli]|uniref:Excisionase family DNA binding protein n=1 Tax=Nonomuraea soli TaxID=1032476 RepID=A0A7W0HUC0_9ACTN|nr:helix-turn-helix domain-containing protein [Nonomuraea soli]MBA2895631.1 excisionase family DNA binding protein [Nonomuraea soli]